MPDKCIDTVLPEAILQTKLDLTLHKEYWIRNSTRDHIDVKVEIIVLTNDTNAMERISDFAEKEFIELYESNKRAISKLNEVLLLAHNGQW